MSERRRQVPRRDIVVRCKNCGCSFGTTEGWIDGEWRVEPKSCPVCGQIVINQDGRTVTLKPLRR